MNAEPAINSRATQIINCNEKVRYRTQADTLHAIGLRLANEHCKKPPPLFAYQCGICHGWHKTKRGPFDGAA